MVLVLFRYCVLRLFNIFVKNAVFWYVYVVLSGCYFSMFCIIPVCVYFYNIIDLDMRIVSILSTFVLFHIIIQSINNLCCCTIIFGCNLVIVSATRCRFDITPVSTYICIGYFFKFQDVYCFDMHLFDRNFR